MHPIGGRRATRVTSQAGKDRPHIEAAVESALEFCDVAVGVLGELDGVVRARDGGLLVALNGAYGIDVRVSRTGGAGANHDAVVDAGVCRDCEVRQTVGHNGQRAHQALVDEGRHGFRW